MCLAQGDGFSGQFFRIFEIIIFCFVVAIFDLVHDVEAIFTFLNCKQNLEILSEMRVMPVKLQFVVSRASLIF